MVPNRHFAPPELPLFTRIVVPIDMVLCLWRLVVIFALLAQIGAVRKAGGSTLLVLVPLVANAAIVAGTLLAGTLLLCSGRFGVFVYYVTLLVDVALAVLGLFAAAIMPAPVESGIPADLFLLVLTFQAIVLLMWLVLVREAVARASRLFRFQDAPAESGGWDFVHLPTYSGLRELSLAQNRQLANKDCEFLGRVASLQRLDLSQTGIGDDGVRQLAGLANLTHLDLSSTQVSSGVLEILDRMPSLVEVSLDWSRCPRAQWVRYAANRWNVTLPDEPPPRLAKRSFESFGPERIRRPF
jgi:hypothetical protein